MDEPMQRKCDQLVKSLVRVPYFHAPLRRLPGSSHGVTCPSSQMKRSQGVHFSRPVEWKKMGLTDYPKLIKDPMDLGTVSERTSKTFYTRLEGFVNDVRLVWVRCAPACTCGSSISSSSSPSLRLAPPLLPRGLSR